MFTVRGGFYTSILLGSPDVANITFNTVAKSLDEGPASLIVSMAIKA